MKFIKKFLEYFLVFFIIISFNFFLPRLMPGDPFTNLSSDEGSVNANFSEEEIERYKAYYGLDRPIGEQYIDYIKKVFKGDLGYSIYYNERVSKLIGDRISWTLGIALISLGLSSLVGVFLASISSLKKDTYLDRFIYFFMVLLSEIPSFLIAIILLFFLGAKRGLFPLSGAMTVFSDYSGYEKFRDIISHGFLPVLSLGLSQVGGIYLLARSSMVNIAKKTYMETARAKGLKSRRIIFKHLLKNALLPIVTRLFLSLGSILSMTILVENVFNYPGIGKLMRDAVFLRDYILIQGIFLVVSIFVLGANLLSDLSYKKLDPRVT